MTVSLQFLSRTSACAHKKKQRSDAVSFRFRDYCMKNCSFKLNCQHCAALLQGSLPLGSWSSSPGPFRLIHQ